MCPPLKIASFPDDLPAERFFEEFSRILPRLTWEEVLQLGPCLAKYIPELEPMLGFNQFSPYHAYDLFSHTAHVVGNVPEDLTLRWAALLHDTGKIPTFTRDETGRGHFYGHAEAGAQIADTVLRRLNAPDALRERAVTLIGLHMTRMSTQRSAVRQMLDANGAELMDQLLTLQDADMRSKGMGRPAALEVFPQVRIILNELLAERCQSV